MVAIDKGMSTKFPLQIADIEGTIPVGTGLIEPLIARFCTVAPVDVQVILPDGEPESADASRT